MLPQSASIKEKWVHVNIIGNEIQPHRDPVICSNKDEEMEASMLREMSQTERQRQHDITGMLNLKKLTTRKAWLLAARTWRRWGDVGGDNTLSDKRFWKHMHAHRGNCSP